MREEKRVWWHDENSNQRISHYGIPPCLEQLLARKETPLQFPLLAWKSQIHRGAQSGVLASWIACEADRNPQWLLQTDCGRLAD